MWLLCTPEQLGESLAGYMLEGDGSPWEVWTLTCCVFHLSVASVLCGMTGAETMRAAINCAANLRAAGRTNATVHQPQLSQLR